MKNISKIIWCAVRLSVWNSTQLHVRESIHSIYPMYSPVRDGVWLSTAGVVNTTVGNFKLIPVRGSDDLAVGGSVTNSVDVKLREYKF